MLFIVNRDQNLDDILPQLLEYQVEGILVTVATLSSMMAKECERWGRPMAMINRYVLGVHASWFCCANYEGGKWWQDCCWMRITNGQLFSPEVKKPPPASTVNGVSWKS